jgi:hypothetical protein
VILGVNDEIVVRLNPHTNEVENVEILFYLRAFAANERLDIAILH